MGENVAYILFCCMSLEDHLQWLIRIEGDQQLKICPLKYNLCGFGRQRGNKNDPEQQ